MTPSTRNDDALRRLEPYLVASPWHLDLFDLEPMGFEIERVNLVDPTRLDAEMMFDRLGALDAMTFGPEGMPMPRWLFYEASALPGGIFGFATRAETLTQDLRDRLGLASGAEGLVPVSMYIAIPADAPGVWCGHNLASLNRVVPELKLSGLASITKAVALRCFRCEEQIGATQWDSKALFVHTKFGPLELHTAWTPAHAFPATLTYRLRVTEAGVRNAMGDPDAPVIDRPKPDFEIAADDTGAMQGLQKRIEAGERFVIAGPPRLGTDRLQHVPVAAVREETTTSA
ncbi:MAG: hypothetical protein K8E66_00340 [Phycisphaerales bacterium]|nr:hypothetical protein [Phycisphaerales bacterium]